MIARCLRCGCCWDVQMEEACSGNKLCLACQWDLEPGDLVVCVEWLVGDPFLLKGWTYTVTELIKQHGQNWITVYGSDVLFPLGYFRLTHKPGDTDLRSGM